VFRAGEGALQVLPPLVDVIPEARLNLVSRSTCRIILSQSLKIGAQSSHVSAQNLKIIDDNIDDGFSVVTSCYNDYCYSV
jgi:hypothetical protein